MRIGNSLLRMPPGVCTWSRWIPASVGHLVERDRDLLIGTVRQLPAAGADKQTS